MLNEKILYLDAGCGISGDMTVGALIDLGADRKALERALASIPDKSFTVKISRTKKSAIDCCSFSVILDREHENHDHDMNYLYGSFPEEPERIYAGNSASGASHDAFNEDASAEDRADHHHHHHQHRNLTRVREILSHVEMTDSARLLADRIFEILAEAESRAHGVPVDEVHFHEVGAIDSIVDIVSAAVCFDSLGITDVFVSPLTEGTGTVRTQHGLLPVPVPAVVNIVEMNGLELTKSSAKGEYVTPTGAAFAAAVRTMDSLPDHFRIVKTGTGAGKREQQLPAIFRAMIIETGSEAKHDAAGTVSEHEKSGSKAVDEKTGAEAFPYKSGADEINEKDNVVKLETNIDDCSGEILGYTMEKLFRAGARDVNYSPVFMKKNRPGWQMNVICDEKIKYRLENIIFSETTTIGIREIKIGRVCLQRKKGTVETPYGNIAVKKVTVEGEDKIYPEYESAADAAGKAGVPLAEIFRAVDIALGRTGLY